MCSFYRYIPWLKPLYDSPKLHLKAKLLELFISISLQNCTALGFACCNRTMIAPGSARKIMEECASQVSSAGAGMGQLLPPRARVRQAPAGALEGLSDHAAGRRGQGRLLAAPAAWPGPGGGDCSWHQQHTGTQLCSMPACLLCVDYCVSDACDPHTAQLRPRHQACGKLCMIQACRRYILATRGYVKPHLSVLSAFAARLSLRPSPGLLNAHLFCISCLFPSHPEANVFRPGWPARQVRGMPAGRRGH